MITEYVYVGDAGLGRAEVHASPARPTSLVESLNEFGAMGVSHLQLRFRARSIDELCDQMAASATRSARTSPADRASRRPEGRFDHAAARDAPRLPGSRVRPGVRGRDLRRRARAVPLGRRAGLRLRGRSRSTTGSTTVGSRRRSPWPRVVAGMTERIPMLAERDRRPVARPRPARRAARGARPRDAAGGCGPWRRGVPARGVRDGRRRDRQARQARSRSTSA